MAKIKTICHICGNKSKTKTPLSFCPACGADVVDTTAEYIVKQAAGQHIIGAGGSWSGHITITNKRMLFVVKSNGASDSTAALAGGLIGLLIMRLISAASKRPKTIGFDLKPGDIERVDVIKKGLFKNIVITAGNTVHQLQLGKKLCEEWAGNIEDFKNAISI